MFVWTVVKIKALFSLYPLWNDPSLTVFDELFIYLKMCRHGRYAVCERVACNACKVNAQFPLKLK